MGGVSKFEPSDHHVRADSSLGMTHASSNARISSIGGDIKPSTSSSSGDVKPQQIRTNIVQCKKKFNPDELRNVLMPIWKRLHDMDEAIPFRVPVDPDLLEIPVRFGIFRNI
jgi:hypothetical protein